MFSTDKENNWGIGVRGAVMDCMQRWPDMNILFMTISIMVSFTFSNGEEIELR